MKIFLLHKTQTTLRNIILFFKTKTRFFHIFDKKINIHSSHPLSIYNDEYDSVISATHNSQDTWPQNDPPPPLKPPSFPLEKAPFDLSQEKKILCFYFLFRIFEEKSSEPFFTTWSSLLFLRAILLPYKKNQMFWCERKKTMKGISRVLINQWFIDFFLVLSLLTLFALTS